MGSPGRVGEAGAAGIGSTGVFLQVRIDSTRLPRKALLSLGGRTVIEQVMASLHLIPASLYLLLTDEASLDQVAPLAARSGFLTFAGPKEDVLGRFALALLKFGPETIVRATGDNPLVSAELATRLLLRKQSTGADYSAFDGPPIGTGVEVVDARALIRAANLASDPYEREHVCPYLYRRPGEFTIDRSPAPTPYCLPDSSVTLDTEADYRFLTKLYKELYQSSPIETLRLIEWLKTRNRDTTGGYSSGTKDPFHSVGAAG